MAQNVQIRGFKETMASFKNMAATVDKSVIRPALNAALKPVRQQARSNAKNIFKSNSIERLIKSRVVKSKKGLIGKVFTDNHGERTITVKGRQLDFSVAALIQEFGKNDGTLPANPFMRPALDQKRNEALNAFKKRGKEQIEKKAKKLAEKNRLR